ncbi:hypothetical protein [Leucobacter sp. 1207-22]|uniref:hypothetical protein n=1 Tax=Leucobacter sp. 1207-22 TaxID=2604456 RepID=UPI004064945F
MKKLSKTAVAQIEAAGLTVAQYTAHCGFEPDEWGGDELCACVDDRCTGHHHGDFEECGCTAYFIEEIQLAMEDKAALEEFRVYVGFLNAREQKLLAGVLNECAAGGSTGGQAANNVE